MSLDYAWEKFHMAIHTLTGEYPIKERLVDAYISNIIHVKANDVPEEIKKEFEEFCQEMTRHEAEGDEGSVQATVNRMEDLEVLQKIENIISFYDTIARHSGSM